MTIKVGRTAEDVVLNYLKRRGFTIIARNVSFPFGELDLVASLKGTMVFIEVKYRKNNAFGFPYEAVSQKKQRKIILAAKAFLKDRPGAMPHCRFDVISLSGDLTTPSIEHIEDAFWVEDY